MIPGSPMLFAGEGLAIASVEEGQNIHHNHTLHLPFRLISYPFIYLHAYVTILQMVPIIFIFLQITFDVIFEMATWTRISL